MFSYDLSRTCDEIRPGCHHVETCQQTVPEAFTAFLEGTVFEDVIRTAVSLGGDCDTLTCIAGSMAEAMYGVPLRFGLHSVDTEDGKRWLVVFTSGEEYEKGESASTMVETVKRMLRGCEVGEAKITAGYDLKAEYVIHTVGPVYQKGDPNCEKLLAACYTNSLNLAREYDLHTIAFPAISTGVYGYPPLEAAAVALRTVSAWLSANPNYGMAVAMNCFDRKTGQCYQNVIDACAPGKV